MKDEIIIKLDLMMAAEKHKKIVKIKNEKQEMQFYQMY